MIGRVISGGQTGADQAGWRAAKAAGIPTGGWMPKGYLTEDGPRPEFAELYGAKETTTTSYPHRTRLNAREADATLWFGDPNSRGGRATLRECPTTYLIVWPTEARYNWPPARVDEWLADPRSWPGGIKTLNVAGNRESSSPGIGAWVERYLAEVFRLLKPDEQGED